MAPSSPTPLAVHRLTRGSPEFADVLPSLIALSNAIFRADHASKYAAHAIWAERIADPRALIVYLAPDRAAGADPAPVALLFAHPRTHRPPLRAGDAESMHICLAGVAAERRKEGCLARMIDELRTARADCFGGLLTVCTFPEVYPSMWRWLTTRGWEVERDMGDGKFLLSLRASPSGPADVA